jgi:hypothetical protein
LVTATGDGMLLSGVLLTELPFGHWAPFAGSIYASPSPQTATETLRSIRRRGDRGCRSVRRRCGHSCAG